VFGNGCATQFTDHFATLGLKRPFVATDEAILPTLGRLFESLESIHLQVEVYDRISTEPTVEMFGDALRTARAVDADAIIGIGGGSVLDVAKLVAAFMDSEQEVHEAFGIGKMSRRGTFLACFPTTSGTGSEVSPNAILLDSADQLKKGVVSPYLVPDVAYVDPLLTVTVPPAVTAATGIDALTHCIEAYANRFAHPVVDLYALEGIRLIGANLRCAVENGDDVEARMSLSLGSLYGGLCLGPVNTAAVHALAYPLGGEFHVAHGVSNALLLPYVLEFNLPAAPERYAEVALTLGAEPADSPMLTAERGVERIRELSGECGIPSHLSEVGVPKDAIERMAKSAMTVTRLLRNNVRELTLQDAQSIYEGAY
jgi:alcohol dehydrogenase class IV